MSTRIASYMRQNVLGMVAIFIALTGSAYAIGKLPKNSVGTKQIKNGSVTGKKVANNTLTGQNINASTLGTVPSAAHAANSDQLGGLGASAFQLRVSGNCPSGAINQVNQNGSVGCASSGGPPSGPAGGDLSGTYPNPTLSAGSVGPSNFGTIPGVRARNSTGTNISDSTTTALTFDTNDYDNDSMHSTSTNTSRLTAPIDGVYEITGDVIWHPNATATRVMEIVKNGTTTIAYTEVPVNSSATDTGQQVTTQVKLSAGDYVELDVFQNSGSTIIISGLNDESPVFAMHWLGP